jgi:hypothetical protein
MSTKVAELIEQLTGQLASDVADKVRMDIDLGTFIAENLDYTALAEKTIAEMDMDDVASDVMDRLDYTDIASNLDMGDLAREVTDELDLEDIARTIRNNHADELAIEVAGHLARSDLLLDTMGQIADDRIASVTDFLIPEARREVLAADVADRLKQSDDMRDFVGEITRQLVRKEVRSLFIDLVKLMTSPEQWRGAAQEGPVDLGELRLEPVQST